MSKLKVELTGNVSPLPVLVAEGEEVAVKREGNAAVAYVETDKKIINLKMYRYIDMGGTWWFVVQLLLFVFSFFGLFDIGRQRTHALMNVDADVALSVTDKVTLRISGGRAGEKVVSATPSNAVRLNVNEYRADEAVEKTMKRLKTAKIITAFAVIAAAVCAVVCVIML